MNVLSLFDGMSCGRIALERAGIPVTNYYASEIDKHAIKVSEANYPDIIRLGDVTKVKIKNGVLSGEPGILFAKNSKIDLVIAGSPCQGFSFAGKQLNFEDPRSKLFFDFVRILKECRRYNPDVLFMLENVKMKQEYQDVISESLGVKPIEINSALVSAQNRKRLYWTNIEGIEQPEDKGILLRDILEDSTYDFGAGRIVGRKINPDTGKRDDYNSDIPTIQRFEFNSDIEKTNCLTTVQKDNALRLVGMASDINGKDIIKRVYSPNHKSHTLTAVQGGNQQKKVFIGIDEKEELLKGINYKILTPIEYERLQTVPDNYTESVSNSQRYKMLGNGWTVDVIAHIFNHIKL